jgi:hypothetical protein
MNEGWKGGKILDMGLLVSRGRRQNLESLKVFRVIQASRAIRRKGLGLSDSPSPYVRLAPRKHHLLSIAKYGDTSPQRNFPGLPGQRPVRLTQFFSWS